MAKEKKSSTEKKIKKSFTKKIVKFVLALAAIAAAVAAVAKFIDNLLEKKRQEKNEESDIKEYSGVFKSIAVKLNDYGLAGIISKTFFSSVNIDLSEATFKQDAFITLNANFSAVDITMPEGYSVSFDGLFNKCSVKNAFEGEDIKDPVIYIAAKANYCAIRIFKK